jgi:4-amino-4-deoxy-L-arabinose transferase-like glycosyltransferase
MLQSWQAFLFGGFDAGGFVAVDKPPLGLWVQVLSARLFGFNGVALLLPQAVAGIVSVACLYLLVRRAFGSVAGLLAATMLAVTPISVVTDRNNTMDSQLVLVLMLAVWAASLAAERGKLGWLLTSAGLVGLAYNIKMLQAYPVVPALGLAYLLFAPLRRSTRVGHLALAAVVLLAASLSWSLAVDLTPASLRPYVGSSGTNSALSLALGYNGVSRITLAIAEQVPALSFLGTAIDLTVAPIFAPGIGAPGLLRLFQPGLGGQASWLLGLAMVGLVAAGWQAFRERAHTSAIPNDDLHRRQRISLTLWGGWLLAWGAIFTFARFYHVYYLIMFGPAVAALAGIGVVALWQRDGDGRLGTRLILPLVLLASAAIQLWFLLPYGDWLFRLGPAIVGGVSLSAVGLVAAACLPRKPLTPLPPPSPSTGTWGYRELRSMGRRGLRGPADLPSLYSHSPRCLKTLGYAGPPCHCDGEGETVVTRPRSRSALAAWLAGASASVGVTALLVAPIVWSTVSVVNGNGAAWLPEAGPRPLAVGGFPGFGGGTPAFGPGFPGFGVGRGGPGPGPGPGRPGFGGGVQGPPARGPGVGPDGNTPPPPIGRVADGRGPRAVPAPGGPPLNNGGGVVFTRPGGGALTFAGDAWTSLDADLVRYLVEQQGSARYLVATESSSYASLFILHSGRPAMALGGYQGWDRILTPDALVRLVDQGVVRFFYLSGRETSAADVGPLDGTADLTAWVRARCAVVAPSVWRGAADDADDGPALGGRGRSGFGGAQQVYDCAGR